MTQPGCVTSAAPVSRSLPQAPSYLAPVPVPALTAGQDARSALARSRGALSDANGRLTASREWYDGVRRSYGSGP
jgi:hypothetical protein